MAYRVFPESKPARSEPRPPVFGRRAQEPKVEESRRTKRLHMAAAAALTFGFAGLALYFAGVI